MKISPGVPSGIVSPKRPSRWMRAPGTGKPIGASPSSGAADAGTSPPMLTTVHSAGP